jgi:16S rRNA (cytosine1402-N4)-methyltransferase
VLEVAKNSHQPVLLNEVIEILQPSPNKKILDATLGRGGHTQALLELGAEVWAMDQDLVAIESAQTLVKKYPGRLHLRHQNFRALSEVTTEVGTFDGILIDLGVSSPQLDQAERGFSFMRQGPLDMRMNQSQKLTAEFLVNHLSVDDLVDIFRKYGEEPQAKRAAQAIVKAREQKPLVTTMDLAELLQVALRGGARGHHPATRVFQALRIAVNDEHHALLEVLAHIPQALHAGGRVAIISFHSLEDRAVKQWIAHLSTQEIRAEGMAFGVPNPEYCFKKLGDWSASEVELSSNPRARSARLRAAQKLEVAS